MMNHNEQVIDLKDLLAEVLFRWKAIVLAGVVCAVLGGGYAAYKNTYGSYDRQVAAARALLDEDEISRVEERYAEHETNVALQQTITDNARRAVIMQMDTDNAAIRQGMYAIETDQDYLVNNLESLIMDDAFYAEAAQVLGDDVQPEYITDLFSAWKGSTGETGDSIVVKTSDRNTAVYYLQAMAYTAEQADALLDILEERLETAISNMQDVDADITVTSLGRNSVQVSADMIASMQQSVLNSTSSAISQLQSADDRDVVPAFSEGEQAYYNLLIEDEDVKDGTRQPASYVKMVVLGGAAGVLLVLVWMFLQLFLLDRKVRSLAEMEAGTGIPTLAVFDDRAANCKDPIVRCGIKLQTGDRAVADATAYRALLTSRIEALLSQHHVHGLYLYDAATPAYALDGDLADAPAGVPERSAAEMKSFLDADHVILVTRMYETTMTELDAIVNLCRMHGKKIVGNIVIYHA